jgi:hypothetical protein
VMVGVHKSDGVLACIPRSRNRGQNATPLLSHKKPFGSCRR